MERDSVYVVWKRRGGGGRGERKGGGWEGKGRAQQEKGAGGDVEGKESVCGNMTKPVTLYAS